MGSAKKGCKCVVYKIHIENQACIVCDICYVAIIIKSLPDGLLYIPAIAINLVSASVI